MRNNIDDCTLEAVPKSELVTSYTYSVPENSPPYALIHESRHGPPIESTVELPPDSHQKPRRALFLSWPCLVVYAILVAVAAGVVGGLLGKHIATKSYEQDRATFQQGASGSQACTSPVSPAASATSTPTSASAFAIPTTGCTPVTQQRSFKSITKFLAWPYTTWCATGWGNDELVAMAVSTPSDCVEACAMYNTHKGSNERQCVGGGFIPEWVNQSQAMEQSGGMPYNCFLKSNDTGTGRNNKNFEVVSLCMQGACLDVMT
ncbi:hypothetical protein HBH56_213590 [Parastagonospora nodorum]|uniref:Uncharacterized protein n=2 Tax=Phaeosphaeria nodorum (strain SN15 / ATCC MYA-4574 / FGSC 10173) TaxID=321614 RepID=A0A7U2F7C9_PHANO|nr:hypothetical protein SNOG_15190 [Parastagonospora nodorum SN15]KAH3905787.1 hypothetical protein HBH56_213590 [Parastagonospora nodorum]EAT77415.2 hypothetical protein SNOG_15190 [Parastagonospora nodorum SN15]KAH3923088.1 hypothetical protein HBH54_215260 [Parastagonospora nodorum]KAH3941862.1 hypothetical protein HBH53_196830 [Parastagonospora nodorum]KAH3960986.1 hypothetical protein HBH51_186650 [Parastagonospora nodorum]